MMRRMRDAHIDVAPDNEDVLAAVEGLSRACESGSNQQALIAIQDMLSDQGVQNLAAAKFGLIAGLFVERFADRQRPHPSVRPLHTSRGDIWWFPWKESADADRRKACDALIDVVARTDSA